MALCGWLGFPSVAHGDTMDPVLSRLWQEEAGGLVTRDDLFDALALEYAMALAPPIHAPAETLGWSGFFMGVETTLSVIGTVGNHLRCGVENGVQNGGNGGDGACDSWTGNTDGVFFIPAIHLRKGLPYSFELGFHLQYVLHSELVGVGGELRWSPFEGFRSGALGYFPDIAFRLSGTYISWARTSWPSA